MKPFAVLRGNRHHAGQDHDRQQAGNQNSLCQFFTVHVLDLSFLLEQVRPV
jgi:hypothetical protein